MTGVIFDSLTVVLAPKLQALLGARSEPYADDVSVSNKVIPGRRRMVTLTNGPGLGTFDTLDDTTLRVNVYADNESDAEDLAILVRALFEAPAPTGIRDGLPVTATSVNAGPVEVPGDTKPFHWYMVINIRRRGSPFN